MQANRVPDWTKAIELLDLLLRMPAERRNQAAAHLGAEHRVAAELGALLTSLARASVLDGSLAPVLFALADRERVQNELSSRLSDAGILPARDGGRRPRPDRSS